LNVVARCISEVQGAYFEDLIDYNVNLSKANSFDSICLQISHGKAAIDHRSRRRALQGGGHQEVQEHA
jgi:hypothetical protein